MLVNRYGRGMAVYTNLDISAYGSSKGAGVRGEVIFETRGAEQYVRTVQAIFQQVFQMAGTRPRVTISRNGKPFDSGETFYYTDDTRIPLYVGVMINLPQSQQVLVSFFGKAHIYDVRERKYMGFTQSFVDEYHPGRMQVYAALPYRVDSIDVSLDGPRQVFARGTDVRFNARVKAETRKMVLHVFRVEVFYPTGKPAHAYTRNVRAPRGELSYTIPLGYNAPRGKWKVLVKDIASQTGSALYFDVW